MPLQFTNVDVALGGLDQKVGPLVRVPGALDRAINVEFDKVGQLNKRRGYQFVDVHDTVGAFVEDDIMCHLAVLGGELVIFTRSHVASVGSREGRLRGADAIVYRGPNGIGACASRFLTMSRISEEYAEEPED